MGTDDFLYEVMEVVEDELAEQIHLSADVIEPITNLPIDIDRCPICRVLKREYTQDQSEIVAVRDRENQNHFMRFKCWLRHDRSDC